MLSVPLLDRRKLSLGVTNNDGLVKKSHLIRHSREGGNDWIAKNQSFYESINNGFEYFL